MLMNHPRRRKATVAVVAAVCIIGLLSVVALSLDGGLLLDKRRKAQAAADAAALAAGCELFKTWFTKQGLDPDGTAAAFAKQVAKDNGYEDGKNGVTVTVNIPPLSGPFKALPGHAEVIIAASQGRYFSKIFKSKADVGYGARAVARGKRSTINLTYCGAGASHYDASGHEWHNNHVDLLVKVVKHFVDQGFTGLQVTLENEPNGAEGTTKSDHDPKTNKHGMRYRLDEGFREIKEARKKNPRV